MEQVCRACMTSSVALVDIFTDRREPSLADMLNECVDCEIKLEDQLPKNICFACIVEVQAAFGFKRKCEKSHQVLSAKLIKSVVEVECDTIEAVKMEPTEEDVDLHNEKMEPEEFIGTEEKQKECNFTEESYADDPIERMPISTDLNIQSELLKMESWELAEGNIDLGYVKIEEDAALSTEIEHTEGCSTAVEVCAGHIRTRTGERPYKCPYCPRAFSQASNLRHHLCIHSGERPFKCPHCPKTFPRLNNLQSHVPIHPGKQIHKCPHCTRYFLESAELEEHIRCHTGERRTFNCTECSKEFGYVTHLKMHIRTHTENHPIQCPHCLQYVKKGNLGRHLRSHIKRPYKCPHCPITFARAAYLKVHINTHSKENP